MTYELITALAAFAFVASITPGPNNLMLLSSGANFGFQRTIPHMLGVGLGFAFMLILIGIGLIKVFEIYPISKDILKTLSIIYLAYLAFKISTSATPLTETQHKPSPLTFMQAALFQWVNPKAWTMALTAISVYSPDRDIETIIIIGIIFGLVNLPSVSIWTILGLKLRYWLTNYKRRRFFNYTMASMLLCSLYPVLTAG
jgi:threonine/homoserine/homoserine lactone efflux protein